jgi:cysteine synthase B
LGPDGPLVLWGGLSPAGSLKYFTFRELLADCDLSDRAGLVEISGASTAFALAALAKERKLLAIAVCDQAGATYLAAHGYDGEVHTVPDMKVGFEVCTRLEQEGFFWPRQFTNRKLIGCVESWARPLAKQALAMEPGLKRVVSGFGTGATLSGLALAFAAHSVQVVGVQGVLPGWRRFSSQNLGEQDLFWEDRERISLLDAPEPTASHLEALRAHVGPEPSRTLIISHSGAPRSAHT